MTNYKDKLSNIQNWPTVQVISQFPTGEDAQGKQGC